MLSGTIGQAGATSLTFDMSGDGDWKKVNSYVTGSQLDETETSFPDSSIPNVLTTDTSIFW